MLLVSVSAPVLAVPEVGCVPVHAPLAVHEVASLEDQFRLLLPPLGTLVGLAEIETVGAGDPELGGTGTGTGAMPAVSPPPLPPPQPATRSVQQRASRLLSQCDRSTAISCTRLNRRFPGAQANVLVLRARRHFGRQPANTPQRTVDPVTLSLEARAASPRLRLHSCDSRP